MNTHCVDEIVLNLTFPEPVLCQW